MTAFQRPESKPFIKPPEKKKENQVLSKVKMWETGAVYVPSSFNAHDAKSAAPVCPSSPPKTAGLPPVFSITGFIPGPPLSPASRRLSEKDPNSPKF